MTLKLYFSKRDSGDPAVLKATLQSRNKIGNNINCQIYATGGPLNLEFEVSYLHHIGGRCGVRGAQGHVFEWYASIQVAYFFAIMYAAKPFEQGSLSANMLWNRTLIPLIRSADILQAVLMISISNASESLISLIVNKNLIVTITMSSLATRSAIKVPKRTHFKS
jgi:hypothetical protein